MKTNAMLVPYLAGVANAAMEIMKRGFIGNFAGLLMNGLKFIKMKVYLLLRQPLEKNTPESFIFDLVASCIKPWQFVPCKKETV